MFKEKTSFSSRVRAVTPSEYCEQLSIASIADLKQLFPKDIDIEGNPDIVLNAFNATVVNRINANDDGIATDTALSISRKFIHKFTDIEHDRGVVVGHIVSQGFSQFGSNLMIASEESLANVNTPFNVALGAVVYRTVNPRFAAELVESSDETSPKFGEISASWELGFNKYQILLGHRDVAEGELITDEKQIAELAKLLRCYGGSGKTKDDVAVYRLIIGGLPLGIGYTTNPAADVKGVVTPATGEAEARRNQPEVIIVTTTPAEAAIAAANELKSQFTALAKEFGFTFEEIQQAANQFQMFFVANKFQSSVIVDEGSLVDQIRAACVLSKSSGLTLNKAIASLTMSFLALKKEQKSGESFSQTQNKPVKKNSIMELKSLSDITDDLLKSGEVSQANLTAFIASEIVKSNEIYKQQLADKEKSEKTLAERVENSEKLIVEATDTLKKTNDELKQVKEARDKELADRTFNERMAAINEKFELDDKLSAIVATEVAGLDDDGFKKAFEKYEILFAGKVKKAPVQQAAATVVATVIASATPVQQQTVANTVTTDPSTFDKFKAAFEGDNAILIKSR